MVSLAAIFYTCRYQAESYVTYRLREMAMLSFEGRKNYNIS